MSVKIQVTIEAFLQNCSVKKGVLRTFAKFTEKHQCQGLFFNKVAGLRPATLLKRESGAGGFRFTFFNKTPVVAASVTSSKWTDK